MRGAELVTDTGTGRQIPVTAITVAAITAVAFWSLKPIFITEIGDRGDYAEVYIASASISVVTSAVVSLFLWRKVVALARGGRRTLSGILSASASGFFLALWYYGFYRALYGADKADATVIAFTWPLIAVVVTPLIARNAAAKLQGFQWLLVLASFGGAVAIGVSGLGHNGGPTGESGEIVWAFVAAIGSGLYLPFAINATNAFNHSVRSQPIATFFAISVANVVALAGVLLSLRLNHHTLRFYAFDREVFVICALIGIGTYLVAEVTWTWAFREYKSLTLSSLPYFSPAVSVVLLHVLFNEPVRPIAALGLVIILFSNLTLHARQRSANAVSLTLIASVYVALGSQLLPDSIEGPTAEMAAAMTGVFAILAGFILSRVAGRRTEELDARTRLVQAVMAADTSDDHEEPDWFLRNLLELEFERYADVREDRALAIIDRVRTGVASPDTRREVVDAFAEWRAIHMDRLSVGEWAALWITGLGSILTVLLLRGPSFLGNVGAVAFAAGAFLVMFTIYDYDRNNIHGFKNQLWRLEQGFREIGKPYYVPTEVLGSGDVNSLRLPGTVRTSVDGDYDATREVEVTPTARTFTVFYLSTAALAIVAVMLLPFASAGGYGDRNVFAPRPGSSAESELFVRDGSLPTITIADPGWPAASVIAQILRHVVETPQVRVKVQSMDQVGAVAALTGDKPSVQIHPDLWLQNQSDSFRSQIDTGKIVLNNGGYRGGQGIYILDKKGEVPLRSVTDLADKATASRFDTDGDGKAEIWAGPRGWESTKLLNKWIGAQKDLRIEGESYSETIFRAYLKREAGKRPLLFYAYEPDWLHEQYSPRLLTADPFKRTGCTTGYKDECGADVDVHVAWARTLQKISPIAFERLARVHVGIDEVNEFVYAVDRRKKTPDEVARDWIAAHRSEFQEWQRP
ncbi:MAG: glycine betaine ABC transporter substrate-binding protein [Gordonia amarae]